MDYTDSALYLLVELIIEAIRQFFTYVEKNNVEPGVGKEFEREKYILGLLNCLDRIYLNA